MKYNISRILKQKALYIKGNLIYLMVRFYTYLELYLEDINKRIYLGEFEKHFKRPHQTIKLHLQELVNKKILIKEKKSRFTFYQLNKTSPLLKEYLVLCEKERLLDFLEKNTLFKRFYDLLSKHLKESKMLIFGSAVNKQNFADIDILILHGNQEIKKTIDEFMKTYSTKIHALQTDEENLTEAFLVELKKQHIILNEHDYFIARLYKNELGLV